MDDVKGIKSKIPPAKTLYLSLTLAGFLPPICSIFSKLILPNVQPPSLHLMSVGCHSNPGTGV